MNIIDQLVAKIFGDIPKDGVAEKIVRKFGLKNHQFLENILAAISGFRAMHSDTQERYDTARALHQFRAEYIKLCRSAKKIMRIQKMETLGGSLMAISEFPSVFSAIQIANSIAGIEHLGMAPIKKRNGSTLAGLLLPLFEYWYDCTDQVPHGQFLGNFEPVEGTASAFVVESLRAAGWSYLNEQVAEQFPGVRRAILASENYRQAAA